MFSSSKAKNGINIREKLSEEETTKLYHLLGNEIPMEQYIKIIDNNTGQEIDYKEAMKKANEPLKPSSCYEYFMDYMNCHKHVSNVLKQAKRNNTFKLNEPDLKVTSVCKKAYQMYEQCTFQQVPDSVNAERKVLKASTLQHFIQDMEYYHTTTYTKEEQLEIGVRMLFDPTILTDTDKEQLEEMKKSTEYQNHMKAELQRRHPIATSQTPLPPITKESIQSLRQEYPKLSNELQELLKKLEN